MATEVCYPNLDNLCMKIAITVCLRHLLDTDVSLNIVLLRIYFEEWNVCVCVCTYSKYNSMWPPSSSRTHMCLLDNDTPLLHRVNCVIKFSWSLFHVQCCITFFFFFDIWLLIHSSTDRLGTTPGNVAMSILIGVHTQLYLGNTYCRGWLLDHNICFSSILLRHALAIFKVGLHSFQQHKSSGCLIFINTWCCQDSIWASLVDG